ncbi:ATP synthase subunit delta [Blattabacterium sp. (Nauphoeta cinerea)]|uniref:ATP synthase F1 subunit delta n=1 Tax=Blattabacterium sp. (Nauphoeta cinerea) TaxID=1316444 RepID=UPI0003B05534|nr:ATP synthase F1 subunit delta [Blattabacterium sp. (Nauphoeta cinerea)]AGW86310.1 ATP synthase subunit delta [Blattabacterium sp. (Nauphoeta cinerea)]
MFSNKKIIQHYAKVFFEYSLKKNSDITYDKIKKISFFLNKNTEICIILHTSMLSYEKKIKIFKKIFFNFDILLFQFIKLLTIRKRESLLKEIFLEYQKIYEENQKGFVKSIIISAFPLRKNIQKTIAHKIISNKKRFHIINRVDKSIIGGFLFRVGYKEWNFSIQEQLYYIKNIFQNH